jgi:hypothetical protein
MYGLLILAVVEYTKKAHGEQVWEKVREKVKIANHSFNVHQQYNETLFLKICKCVADVTSKIFSNHDLLFKFIIINYFIRFRCRYSS